MRKTQMWIADWEGVEHFGRPLPGEDLPKPEQLGQIIDCLVYKRGRWWPCKAKVFDFSPCGDIFLFQK